MCLAEGEEGGGVGGGEIDSGGETLEALGGGGGVVAADVVLEGREWDGAGGSEEGLLGDGEMGVDDARELPGNGVFGVEEAGQFGGVLDGRGELEVVNGEDLGLYGDAVARGAGGDVVGADEYEVGVELLGDADGGGAGGFEVGGEAEMVEGEGAVVAGDGEKAGGAEALVEGVGEGVANPVEGWVAGAIFEGEDEDDAAARLGDILGANKRDGRCA